MTVAERMHETNKENRETDRQKEDHRDRDKASQQPRGMMEGLGDNDTVRDGKGVKGT